MNLYLAIRSGHAESPDGPDGEDMQLLIRASSRDEAVTLADDALLQLPACSPSSKRPVQTFCHWIIELGADASNDRESRVLLEPWVGRVFFDTFRYPMWVRDEWAEKWQDAKAVFPDRSHDT